jgi:hypothetical protein
MLPLMLAARFFRCDKQKRSARETTGMFINVRPLAKLILNISCTCSGSEIPERRSQRRWPEAAQVTRELIGRRRDARRSTSINACRRLFWAFRSRTCSLRSVESDERKAEASECLFKDARSV